MPKGRSASRSKTPPSSNHRLPNIVKGNKKSISSEFPSLGKQFKLQTVNSRKKNAVPLVEKQLSDKEILDTIPYHEHNIVMPMPFFPLTIEKLVADEFRNEGFLYMINLLEKGKKVWESNLEFIDKYDDEYRNPTVEESTGVIFTLADGPVFFGKDIIQSPPDIEFYNTILSVLNPSYEPIFIVVDKKAYGITAEKYNEIYATMFSSE
jgi:hypothetical protein